MTAALRLLHHPLVFRLGLTLLHFLWQGAVLALVAVLALLLLGRARPSSRYLVLLALLSAMALSPLPTFVFLTRVPPPTVITAPALKQLLAESARVRPPVGPGALRASEAQEGRAGRPGLSPAVQLRRARRWISARVPLAVGLWACGVLLLSFRLFARWRGLQAALRRGSPLTGTPWERPLARMAGALRVSRPVRLMQSAAAHSPFVIGWVRPVILLPPAALLGLDPQCLEALLAHELAHIRRHDYAVNLAQTAVETLLFYHPAVWWLSYRVRAEREHCCDDLAVCACGDPLVYARALTGLASGTQPIPELALGADRGPLAERVRRTLGAPATLRRGPVARGASLVPIMVVAVLLAGVHGATLARPVPLEGTLIFQTDTGRPAAPPDQGREYLTTAMRGGLTWTLPAAASPLLSDISPDGNEVAYADHIGDTMTEGAIWKAPVDALTPVNLTAAVGLRGLNCTPRWSPDGGRISFWHAEPHKGQKPCEAGWHVWTIGADGSHPRELAPEMVASSDAAWAPDGRQLLLQQSSKTGEMTPVVIDLATGTRRELPGVGVKQAWSPDGSTIASCRSPKATVAGRAGRSNQLILTDTDGNHPQVLVEQFIADADSTRGHPDDDAWKWGFLIYVGPNTPVWSPSGKQIAFLAALPYDPRGPDHRRQIEVWIYDLASRRLTRVTHDDRLQLALNWRR